MILNEIDYDISLQHVLDEISRILYELRSNNIDKQDALESAELLYISLKTEIALSNISLEEKSKFITIFAMIALLKKDITNIM